MAKSAENESPLMRQHAEMKRQFPDAMLLFRVGDFYETFGEDARKASAILGITLTRKASGGGGYCDLAGIPYHAIDQYLPKLVRSGLRVAMRVTSTVSPIRGTSVSCEWVKVGALSSVSSQPSSSRLRMSW